MAPSTATGTALARFRKNIPPWYWLTRALGVGLVLFGVLVDHTPERGTIILTGAGFVGFDKVARSEPPKGPSS